MKSVKDMTIGDVTKLMLFDIFMGKSIFHFRSLTDSKQISGRTFYSLEEKGVMTSEKMTELYRRARNKTLKDYSTNERYMILAIGDRAFNLTIKVLLKREKTRNLIHRDD